MAQWAIRQGCKGVYREQVVVRLPFLVRREIERQAKAENLTLSDFVRICIERYLEERKKNKE